MTKIQRLEKLAQAIPTMDGVKAGSLLREYAAKSVGCVVEVGAWLGSCTAYLALGALRNPQAGGIHVYDRFEATGSEIAKAAANGVKLKGGQDTEGVFKYNLAPFQQAGVKIVSHKGDVRGAMWNGERIGLYVDDASKRKPLFDHAIKTFGKGFDPGTVLFLMDFFYFEKNPDPGLAYQYEYMNAHKRRYRYIDRIAGTSAAIFEVV